MRKADFTKIKMTANNDIFQGQSIEEMVFQATTTNQGIENTAPIIFTARKDGVIHEYNIRSDKWERAMEMMDKYSNAVTSRRLENMEKNNNNNNNKEIGKTEPTRDNMNAQTDNAVNE